MRYFAKIGLFWMVFGCICLTASASEPNPESKKDSLLATFDGLTDDSLRADSMLKIVFKLGATDPWLGMWLCDQVEAESADAGEPWIRARVHNVRGIIYFSLRIYDLAMGNLLEAARIADAHGLTRIRNNAINNIGSIQEDQGRYSEALSSYRRARAGYLENGSNPNATMALTNVALAYFDLKQYDKALQVCDSVILEIKNPDDVNPFARVYGLMGEIYHAKKNHAKALELLNLSIELAGKGGDDHARAEDMITRAMVKHALAMDDSALADLDEALPVVRKLGVMPFVVDCYDLYAKIARDRGDAASAVIWMERSKALGDSIKDAENATALANYQSLYDVEQKDAEIDLLNKDREIQAAHLLNVWYLFGLASVVLIALIVVLLILVRSNQARRRINEQLEAQNARISEQNEQISQQIAALSQQNEQLNTLNHEMAGMLHVVAHDLKAPLNQVTGLLATMEEEQLSPAQTKMLQLAKKVTDNASSLVQDLVELGSVEHQAGSLHKVSVPLKTLIAEVAATFSNDAARKSIHIELELPAGEEFCTTEPRLLRRVLENLVSNALKFSDPGKKVVIALDSDDEWKRISIEDQGPGISPSDQKNLYRKFHRLSARPTAGETSSGLGLAIVKTLVGQMGGHITLQSEVGVGSTFEVRLPG